MDRIQEAIIRPRDENEGRERDGEEGAGKGERTESVGGTQRVPIQIGENVKRFGERHEKKQCVYVLGMFRLT